MKGSETQRQAEARGFTPGPVLVWAYAQYVSMWSSGLLDLLLSTPIVMK